MTAIRVNYGAMSAGYDGLIATWGRIEAHLSELDRVVAATGDMQAEVFAAYLTLKARWAATAADRQVALRALANSVDAAAATYRQADAAAAAQFTY